MTIKRWMALSLAMMTLMGGTLAVQAQDMGQRTMIYLFNPDFPPTPGVHHPILPEEETRFWQLLDREMKATPNLALTENVEKADYRVNLECTGIFYCSRLNAVIETPSRDVLGSFELKHVKPWFGEPDVEDVAQRFTARLGDRLNLLDQGGYGYMK